MSLPHPPPPNDAPVSHLLYLHGFRSSPLSVKSQKTAARVAELNARQAGRIHWWCPALPPSPAEAMAMVSQGIRDWPVESMAVIGSSLGGFYATYLAEQCACKVVLLNPAVNPARDLVKYLGEQSHWHDPSKTFTVHASYLDELKALECQALTHPERYFSVIAKGDEVLDWREMSARYPGTQIRLLPASDHGLSDFDEHMDAVFAFLNLR